MSIGGLLLAFTWPFRLLAGLIGGVLLLVGLGFLGLGLLLPGLFGLLGVALLAFWIWALIDVVRNDAMNGWSRVFWLVVVWFLPFLGSLIYLAFGRGSHDRPERVAAS